MLLEWYKYFLVNYDDALNLKCNIVYIALKAHASGSWYFNNRFSHHVTRDKSFFINFVQVNDGFVKFSDMNKAMIGGKCYISAIGFLSSRMFSSRMI